MPRCCRQSVDLSIYHCLQCVGGGDSDMLYTADKLKSVVNFCYFGNMLGKGCGTEEASRTRVRCAWGKFNEFATILIRRGPSLRFKVKI